MDTVWIVNGGLGLGLVILAVAYWRSHKAAQLMEAQLKQELSTLQQTTAATQANLEQQLQTMTQQWQLAQRNNAELETQVASLKQQCQRFRDNFDTQAQQVCQDTQLKAFEQIQTLLTQYPSLQKMTEAKPDLPARNVVAVLSALENLTQLWNYKPIGAPWESVAYDTQCHQGDVDDLKVGEPVYVRFVGYRHGDRILIPAKVSRTLPAGLAS